MHAKRNSGESSIYRDDQGRWHGYISMGLKDNGRRDRRHVSGARRADVVTKVRELERARAALVTGIGAPNGRDDAALLATLGVNLDAVRASIEETFGPDAIGRLYARRCRDGHRLGRGPLCGMTTAPRLKRSLEHARRAAKTAHRQRATSLDLVAGLLAVQDGTAVRLLRSLGVDPAGLLAELRPRAAG